MSKFLFLDTETTGVGEDDRLFEVAYIAGERQHEALFMPANGPLIPLGAQAVTDVTNDMIVGKPLFKDSPEYAELETLLQDHILVAHNARFDVDMLEREGLKVPRFIDTLKLAYRLPKAEELENFKLNYIRHWYQIPNSGGALHRALCDTEYLKAIFYKIIEDMPLTEEEMIKITQEPPRPPKCTVGQKHKGKLWKDVPKDYLDWIVNKSDMDTETKAIANYHLTGQASLV